MFEFCSPVPAELGGVGNGHPQGALTPLDFLLHMPPRAGWKVGFKLGRTGVNGQFNFKTVKTRESDESYGVFIEVILCSLRDRRKARMIVFCVLSNFHG